MSSSTYIPERGDIVWLEFNPRAGHEQSGHRPALVVSPKAYNQKVGLALFCPVTTRVKGYPFEVVLPEGLEKRKPDKFLPHREHPIYPHLTEFLLQLFLALALKKTNDIE